MQVKILYGLNNYFSDINETLVDADEMCVPDSNIDPQIVQNISWLPLVSYIKEEIEIFRYFNLFWALEESKKKSTFNSVKHSNSHICQIIVNFLFLLGKPDSIYRITFFRDWTSTFSDDGRNISTGG